MDKINKQIVVVNFLDHCFTDGQNMKPIECEVVGYLIKEDKQAYYVASWICDEKINDDNTDIYVIVKHPGIRIKKVKG